MKKILKKLKSNKGFTIQDVIVAMVILVLFAGTISASFLAIFKIQAETKLTANCTLYGIQILENIDKIGYDEVTNGMEQEYKTKYDIPQNINLSLDVSPYNTNIKKIKLDITYEFAGHTQTISLEKLKVKEV